MKKISLFQLLILIALAIFLFLYSTKPTPDIYRKVTINKTPALLNTETGELIIFKKSERLGTSIIVVKDAEALIKNYLEEREDSSYRINQNEVETP